MVSVNQISLSYGERILFDNISFLINARDRIGLVGNNGIGKTTLLKIILGQQIPDSGIIQKPCDLTIGYLPQQMLYSDSRILFDEAKTAFSQILTLEKEIEKLNNLISKADDYHSESYLNFLNRLDELHTRIDLLGKANIDEQIEKTLAGLGFEDKDFNRKTSEFSGGWRMRIELAKVLLRKPMLLLLDEPTNHLDIESIQWLEYFLKDYPGAVVIISHDKAFLDNVTHRTIEISLGKIYDYKVPFSQFAVLRQERREQQLAAYKNQQKFIGDTKNFIERFRYKATKAVQVQSRIKQLDKLEKIEVDEEDFSALHIKFPQAGRSGDIAIELKDITKSYQQHTVLNQIDMTVRRGERIAFVGKNGEGKTTLSRIIIGELEFSGKAKIGQNVKIGYFAQNQDELLDDESTVFETIDRIAVGDIRTKIRTLLGAFLFRGDDIYKKVKVLSGGERSRLALVKLLLEPHNFLLLDEPTNHLDMRSKDILKNALLNFTGTLILVSHDREFLDNLAEKIYEFKGHKIHEYIGSIRDFLEKKKIDSLRELERKSKDSAAITDNIPVSINKEKYLQKKEFDKVLRKVSNRIAGCESVISELENEQEAISMKLSNPSENIDHSLFERFEEIKKELNMKMHEWERLNKELEELKSNKFG